jgi:CoA-transferase family III
MATNSFDHSIRAALGEELGAALTAPAVSMIGEGALPSVFSVTEMASASVAAAGNQVAGLIGDVSSSPAPALTVDRRLASHWFAWSFRPIGWEPPPVWDPIAGDYRTRDGWIRLHTNAPHHRAAALAVLGLEGTSVERITVDAAVAEWDGDELEAAVVGAGGCAARLRRFAEWDDHPQGRAVAIEPLIARFDGSPSGDRGDRWTPAAARPLAGIRVLDLTRVIAGPVATRFLAGYGAEVLRIDPPDWDEPSIAPEVTLGKRCARLDLRSADGRERLETLLAEADVVVHGYRSDALARLGLGSAQRAERRPGLIDVSLCAYGWSGPWAQRRGFDSLVQMSSGIVAAGMEQTGSGRPLSLPVQALDHATGYLMAAAAVRGLRDRLGTGHGSRWCLSLARTARLLVDGPHQPPAEPFAPLSDDDFADAVEVTAWGPQRRLRPPLAIDGMPYTWDLPACHLGSAEPRWY